MPQIDEGDIVATCSEPCDCIAGEYFGSYEILGTGSALVRDSVEIIFSDSTFSRPPVPLNQDWPYICYGSYTCATDSVHIQNGCAFPANIGSAQIFNGVYKFEVTSDSLFMERLIGTYPTNFLLFRYSLARQ